jgi:hypothetical protein
MPIKQTMERYRWSLWVVMVLAVVMLSWSGAVIEREVRSVPAASR